MIVGRDEVRGVRVRELLVERRAKEALWRVADVTVLAQVEAMINEVIDRRGPVDVLVNNVGGNVDMDDFVDSDRS